MYHCHLRLYFVGQQQQLFETLKAMEPLENFGHTFLESSAPDQALTAQADLILALWRAWTRRRPWQSCCGTSGKRRS